jgi:hypothetical protein
MQFNFDFYNNLSASEDEQPLHTLPPPSNGSFYTWFELNDETTCNSSESNSNSSSAFPNFTSSEIMSRGPSEFFSSTVASSSPNYSLIAPLSSADKGSYSGSFFFPPDLTVSFFN